MVVYIVVPNGRTWYPYSMSKPTTNGPLTDKEILDLHDRCLAATLAGSSTLAYNLLQQIAKRCSINRYNTVVEQRDAARRQQDIAEMELDEDPWNTLLRFG